MCTIFGPSKISGSFIKCLTEGSQCHSEASEILELVTNKLKNTFAQCWTAVKTLFRAFCMPIHACQWWSKYAQTSMKHVQIVYNSPCWCITYSELCLPTPELVRTFDALFRNYMYGFVCRCELPPNSFIWSHERSDAFYKSSVLLHYLTLFYDGDQLQ